MSSSGATRVGADARYALSGLLVCDGCDLLLHPIDVVDGRRGYRSPCGCRLSPVDALTVERLTHTALDRRGLLPAEGVPEPDWPDLFARTVAAVRVGALPDELTFVWRT